MKPMFNMEEQSQQETQEEKHVILSLEIYEAMLNYIGSKPYVEIGGLVPKIIQDADANSKRFVLSYNQETEKAPMNMIPMDAPEEFEEGKESL